MAVIIVEDGSVVANANSYVTVAELQAFAADRGIDTFTGDESELLIQAMDYLEIQNYIGLKLNRDQELQWPRADVYIDGYYLQANTIPKELKNAQMQNAISIDQGNGPNRVYPRKTKREKVDVLEIEYADNSSALASDPKVNIWLRKLVVGGGYSLRVVKA